MNVDLGVAAAAWIRRLQPMTVEKWTAVNEFDQVYYFYGLSGVGICFHCWKCPH